MATAPAQLSLSPFFLLLLFWGPVDAAPEMTVQAPTEVRGFLGNTVTLPCNLESRGSRTPEVTQVTWKRLDPYREPRVVATLHPQNGPRVSEPNRVEFAAAWRNTTLKDASLTVRSLCPEDDANYTCEMTTLSQELRSARTWLRVFYTPQVSMDLYDDIGKQGRRETSLTCDARSNPEPKSYNWSTATGPLPPFAVPQGSRILIQSTEESINMIFICRVSNDLGMGQAAMRVLLPRSPQEPSHSPSAIRMFLPVAGIMFVAALGALVYCWCLTIPQSPVQL